MPEKNQIAARRKLLPNVKMMVKNRNRHAFILTTVYHNEGKFYYASSVRENGRIFSYGFIGTRSFTALLEQT